MVLAHHAPCRAHKRKAPQFLAGLSGLPSEAFTTTMIAVENS